MLNPEVYLPKTKYEWQQWAAGKADAILGILRVRMVEVGDAERERILGEKDLDVLERWLTRAVSATTAGEVLAEG